MLLFDLGVQTVNTMLVSLTDVVKNILEKNQNTSEYITIRTCGLQ